MEQYNVVLLGASYFDGMASSTRVRNLFQPLLNKKLIVVNNLIYQKSTEGLKEIKNSTYKVRYAEIGFTKSNPISIISFFYRGLQFIKKNKSKINKNILYNYSYPNILNILFLLYAKIAGYKIILDITEDIRFHSKSKSLLTTFRIKSSLFLIQFLPYFSDAIISISTLIYNSLSKITHGKIPISFIPITVDLNKFPKQNYIIPNSFKIFYGGSFGQKDGLEYLLKAFEIVSQKHINLELILTGRTDQKKLNVLFNLISDPLIKNKIKYQGYLSESDYYIALNSCDIFCMTRINSDAANAGFPFKLGEFLATGKAVIASDVGDVSSYLKNNIDSILIKPNNVDELVVALSYILDNPEKISSLGNEARNTAETYFDSEKVSTKVLELFKRI